MTWEELANPDKISPVNESPHSFVMCGRQRKTSGQLKVKNTARNLLALGFEHSAI